MSPKPFSPQVDAYQKALGTEIKVARVRAEFSIRGADRYLRDLGLPSISYATLAHIEKGDVTIHDWQVRVLGVIYNADLGHQAQQLFLKHVVRKAKP